MPKRKYGVRLAEVKISNFEVSEFFRNVSGKRAKTPLENVFRSGLERPVCRKVGGVDLFGCPSPLYRNVNMELDRWLTGSITDASGTKIAFLKNRRFFGLPWSFLAQPKSRYFTDFKGRSVIPVSF